MRRTWMSLVLCSLLLALGLAAASSPASAGPGTASYAAANCNQGGWQQVKGADGRTFKNTGECVSYVAKGGTLVPIDAPPPGPQGSVTLGVTQDAPRINDQCLVRVWVTDFPEGESYPVEIRDAATDEVVATRFVSAGADGLGTNEIEWMDPGTYYARVYLHDGTYIDSADTVITC